MSALAAGLIFICTPTAVWDGDGPVWCAEGPKLRVAGIAARERDGSCRSHQPCPKASGVEARDALVRLLGGSRGEFRASSNAAYPHVRVAGPKLTCMSDGDAKGGRTAAWCKLPSGKPLSCALLESNTVKKWKVFWRGHRC